MAKINSCPAGHLLQPWSAERGACDGCRKLVRDGDSVMDCRQCNWYLCEDCHPPAGAQPTFWSTMSALLDVSCQVPTVEVNGSEITINTGISMREPFRGGSNARQDGMEEIVMPSVLERPARNNVSLVNDGEEDSGHGSVQQQPAQKAHAPEPKPEPKAEPKPALPSVDLLGLQAETFPSAPTPAAAPFDLLDLDLKQQPERSPVLSAARLGA